MVLEAVACLSISSYVVATRATGELIEPSARGESLSSFASFLFLGFTSPLILKTFTFHHLVEVRVTSTA
jgi:hypothetical protein